MHNKTTLGATPVSSEKHQAKTGTDSSKLDNKRSKVVLPDITSMTCGIQIDGSEFEISHLKFLENDNEFNMLISTHPHIECPMKECQFMRDNSA